MGLREDIRTALTGVATTLPQASFDMRHGVESGTAVQSSSRTFADSVSPDEPTEAARYVVNAADFPTLEKGSPVEIGDALYLVTSTRIDPVGAVIFIGVSSSFDDATAVYSGTRRGTSAAFEINPTLPVLLHDNGNADDYSGALAPSYARSFTAAIRSSDWTYDTPPQPSDTIDAIYRGESVALKVSTVSPHAGWYILQCRTRG